MPTDTKASKSTKPFTLTFVQRPERKSSTYLTKDSRILLFLRLWASRTCETLSNAFKTSNKSRLATRVKTPA